MPRALALALWTALAAPMLPAAGLIPEAHAADRARVSLALVKAERGEPSFGKGLEPYKRDLSALPFTTFTLVADETWKGGVGESTTVTLGSVKVKLTLQAVRDDGAVLVVDVLRGGKTVSHTTVTRPWGRAQVLSAGQDGGAALVVPVLANR